MLSALRALDAETLEKVEHYKQMLAERQVKELIGETMVLLDGSNKCAETNLGDMIADSLIRFVSIRPWFVNTDDEHVRFGYVFLEL